MARQAQVDLEQEKKELEDSFQRISDQAQRRVRGRRLAGKRGRHPSKLGVGLECCTHGKACLKLHGQLCGLEPREYAKEDMGHRMSPAYTGLEAWNDEGTRLRGCITKGFPWTNLKESLKKREYQRGE